MMMHRIPVYEPFLDSREREIVGESINAGWVSAAGPYVARFEQAFADQCGVGQAVAVSTGTAALHLIFHALGIGPGDEVLIPALTFIATANAVSYTGATPVFVDVEPETWTICPEQAAARVTARTKAVVPVHLYGHPAAMNEIQALARPAGLRVIEDAAEAHFARIGTRMVGGFGDAAAFSFYANKIITTGEGGMVTTEDPWLAERIRALRNHAQGPTHRYWHEEIGFNYRMTSLQAALGLAQLEKAEQILERKAAISRWYREELSNVPWLTLPPLRDGYDNVHWLFTIVLDDQNGPSRDQMCSVLATHGIETRPVFPPLHTQPPYRTPLNLPVAERIGRCGLSLPSAPGLTRELVHFICRTLKDVHRNA